MTTADAFERLRDAADDFVDDFVDELSRLACRHLGHRWACGGRAVLVCDRRACRGRRSAVLFLGARS